MLRRKSKKLQRPKKITSLAFLIAIPASFLLGACTLLSIARFVDHGELDKPAGALFAYGLIAAIGIITSHSLRRLETLVHELKHALVVLLTGNVVRDIEVKRDTGSVTYDLYQTKRRYAPFIILAPYFFPLFSLPLLIVSVIFFESTPAVIALLLGLTLGIDLSSSYQEVHPHQSDFQQVRGGVLLTHSFIVGANLVWALLCGLWIIGGRSGFLWLGYDVLAFATRITKLFGY